MKNLKKIFSIGLTLILTLSFFALFIPSIQAEETMYFHESDEDGVVYYLTAYEYEEYGEEFVDVGVEFQISEDGRRYNVVNTEFVDELLEELKEARDIQRDKNQYPTIVINAKTSRLTDYQSDIYVATDETIQFQILIDVKSIYQNAIRIYEDLPDGLSKIGEATVQHKVKNGENETITPLSYDSTNSTDNSYSYNNTDKYYEIQYGKISNLNNTSQFIITFNAKIDSYSKNTVIPEPLETKVMLKCVENENTLYQSDYSVAKVTVAKLWVTKKTESSELYKNVSFQIYDLEDPENPVLIQTQNITLSEDTLTSYVVDKTSTNTTLDLEEFNDLIVLGLIPGKTYRIEFTSRPDESETLVKNFDFKWAENSSMMKIVLDDLERLEIVETGGSGTAPYTVLGGLLILSSIIVLKKRKITCVNK